MAWAPVVILGIFSYGPQYEDPFTIGVTIRTLHRENRQISVRSSTTCWIIMRLSYPVCFFHRKPIVSFFFTMEIFAPILLGQILHIPWWEETLSSCHALNPMSKLKFMNFQVSEQLPSEATRSLNNKGRIRTSSSERNLKR